MAGQLFEEGSIKIYSTGYDSNADGIVDFEVSATYNNDGSISHLAVGTDSFSYSYEFNADFGPLESIPLPGNMPLAGE